MAHIADTEQAALVPVFHGELMDTDARCGSQSLRTFAPTLTGVDDDLSAARQFLNEYNASPHTRRRYETEITRLFYWAASQNQAVSQLTRADYERYQAFLTDPQPVEVWCGPRRPRTDPRWKPFVQPLTPRSVRHALAAIQSMLAYWQQDGYIVGNPLALKRLKTVHGSNVNPRGEFTESGTFERFFDHSLRTALEQSLRQLPYDSNKQRAHALRLRYLYCLLSATGCRISELAAATQGDCFELDEGWWLHVLGKGRKPRIVPLSKWVLDALSALRQFHGLNPFPEPKESHPLLPPLYFFDGKGNPRKGITPRQVHGLLKSFFEEVADTLARSSPRRAQRLQQGSAHWFRHTFVTRLVEDDVPVKSIMETTGHADERTLRKYNQRLREQRHFDVVSVFNK